MSEYVVKALSLEEFLSRHPMPLATLSRLLGVSEDAARSWSCGRRNPLPQILTHLATLDEKLRENPELREQIVRIRQNSEDWNRNIPYLKQFV
ncbi:MAG: hypothetical protein PUP92_17970 [Rhizonema sp. PD38]|nr:hypothetical protein [Rhizonema sp. PD38]